MDSVLAARLREALGLFNALAVSILALIVVGLLYWGKDVFLPLALATLLSFVLAPPVRLLERRGVWRSIAVSSVVSLTFISVAGLSVFLAGQTLRLAEDLPRYQSTMRDKIRSVRGPAGESSVLGRAATILSDLGQELSGRPTDPQPQSTLPYKAIVQQPIPVEVRSPAVGPLAIIGTFAGPLLHPIALGGLVVIFVFFILLQREDLRARLISIAGTDDLNRTTSALDDAAVRLSRFFLTQFLISVGFGVVIGVGLYLIGIPRAALWGVLAALMRFVPYVGGIIAAAFPVALAIAVDPGWSMLLWTAALFVVADLVTGQIIEPATQGHSTGLSPMAVLIATTFWGLLWGPIGLVLAVPFTVCLTTLGRYTQRLRFIETLLGDRPALSNSQLLYQRLLAGDAGEASTHGRELVRMTSLTDYYDDVVLPALQLARQDLARGSIDADRLAAVQASAREMIEQLGESATARRAGPLGRPAILCISGRDFADETVALVLTQLLRLEGFEVSILGAEHLDEWPSQSGSARPLRLVFLSLMDPPTTVHVRYGVRRIRRQARGADVIVGMWRPRDPDTIETLRRQTSADALVTTLREAVAVAIEAGSFPSAAKSRLVREAKAKGKA